MKLIITDFAFISGNRFVGDRHNGYNQQFHHDFQSNALHLPHEDVKYGHNNVQFPQRENSLRRFQEHERPSTWRDGNEYGRRPFDERHSRESVSERSPLFPPTFQQRAPQSEGEMRYGKRERPPEPYHELHEKRPRPYFEESAFNQYPREQTWEQERQFAAPPPPRYGERRPQAFYAEPEQQAQPWQALPPQRQAYPRHEPYYEPPMQERAPPQEFRGAPQNPGAWRPWDRERQPPQQPPRWEQQPFVREAPYGSPRFPPRNYNSQKRY